MPDLPCDKMSRTQCGGAVSPSCTFDSTRNKCVSIDKYCNSKRAPLQCKSTPLCEWVNSAVPSCIKKWASLHDPIQNGARKVLTRDRDGIIRIFFICKADVGRCNCWWMYFFPWSPINLYLSFLCTFVQIFVNTSCTQLYAGSILRNQTLRLSFTSSSCVDKMTDGHFTIYTCAQMF